MHLWDRFLPQAILTFNMLRNSLINPKIYAATHLDGHYDYNRALMAQQEPYSLHMKLLVTGEPGHHMTRWMVHWTSSGALSMIQGLHQQN
jgi:hypothetical protein